MNSYKTIQNCSEIENIINKSRFIGRCFPVESEEEALAYLNDIRKKHWDARHNCYAYIIGDTGAIARFSDDGEPGGTAGMPMMDVLKNKGITNVLCVVTRYFGGILLGTGGLVRAYSGACRDAVEKAGMISVGIGTEFELKVDYNRFGSIESYIRTNSQVDNIEYTELITIKATVENELAEKFVSDIIDKTDGKVTPKKIGESYIKKEI